MLKKLLIPILALALAVPAIAGKQERVLLSVSPEEVVPYSTFHVIGEGFRAGDQASVRLSIFNEYGGYTSSYVVYRGVPVDGAIEFEAGAHGEGTYLLTAYVMHPQRNLANAVGSVSFIVERDYSN